MNPYDTLSSLNKTYQKGPSKCTSTLIAEIQVVEPYTSKVNNNSFKIIEYATKGYEIQLRSTNDHSFLPKVISLQAHDQVTWSGNLKLSH
jgi:hypothetical protein